MKFKKFLSILLCFLILSSMVSTLYTVSYAEEDHINSMPIGGKEVTQNALNLRGRWSTSENGGIVHLHYRRNDDDSDNNENTKRIYYCLEPGTPLPAVSDSSHITTNDYWKAYDKTSDTNPTIKGETVRKLIGKVLTYGYDSYVNVGSGDYKWRSTKLSQLKGGNDARARILNALATQVLIWEVVVGERDANFNHTPHAERDNVKKVFNFTNNAHENTFNSFYSEIVKKVKNSVNPTKPSFANGKTSNITTMTNNGNYKIELTDNNGVLSDWELDYENNNVISATKSGNKLTITISSSVGDGNEINFNLLRSFKRRKMAIWGDGVKDNGELNFNLQDVVTYVKDTGNNDAYVNDEIKANFKLKVVKNKITVNKSSSDGKKVGFVFKLTGSNIPDLTATTNANGIAEFKGIPNGTYTVSEVLSANAHYVVPESKNITLNGSDKSVNFNNKSKFIRFQFTKIDSETKTSTPQGDATFSGAQYDLYRNGTLLDTYTLGTDGKIYGSIVYGENGSVNAKNYTAYYYATDVNGNKYTYTLKEKTNPTGYQLNASTIALTNSVDNNSGQYTDAPKVDLTENVIKDKIKIYKYSTINESEKYNSPEAGAVFEVYLSSEGSFDEAPANVKDTVTTGENGYATTKDLPYGQYTIEQISGKENAEIAGPRTASITTNGVNPNPVEINNIPNQRNIELRILKTDANNNKPIVRSSAQFNVYLTEDDAKNNTNALASNVTTDATGIAKVPLVIKSGENKTYYIKEVVAPKGYMLSSKIESITINGNEIVSGELNFKQVEFSDSIKKSIFQFTKRGEVFNTDGSITLGALSGAEFNVYADENIYDGTGNIYKLNGIEYKKGAKVKTITSDANSETVNVILPAGKYYLEESKAPIGYLKYEGKHYFEVTISDSKNITTNESSIVIINELKTYNIKVNKKLEVDSKYGVGNKEEYKDVKFGLYASNNILFNASPVPKIIYIKDQLIATTNLNADGIAEFNVNLPFNDLQGSSQSYYIKEISTNEKYELSTEIKEFTINESTNSAITIDFPENKILRGSISGLKVESYTDYDSVDKERPLKDAVIGLYAGDLTLDGIGTAKPIVTYTTGADGKYSFENVPYGTYTVYETTPPTYIDVNGETQYYEKVDSQINGVFVTVDKDNVNVSGNSLKLKNKKQSGYIKIYIHKTAETNNLIGFEFNISNVEDGILETFNKTVSITENNIVEDNNGKYAVVVFNETIRDEYENVITISEVRNDKTIGFKELDSIVLTEDDFTISPDDYTVKEATVSFHNEYLRNDIIVQKELDSISEDTLDGFVFSLEGNTVAGDKYSIDAVITDINGRAVFENVPYGSYIVKEIENEKTDGYILPNPQSIDVNQQEKTLTFKNLYPKGSLKIVKTSEDDKVNNIPFLVENYEFGYSKVHRTDENGNITIDNLRVGTYVVSEVSEYTNEDDDPYIPLDTQSFEVIKDETDPEPLRFNNILKKGRVRIVKTSERSDVEGFEFNIKGTTLNGKVFDETYTTDENGYISNIEDNYIQLKAGTYTVSEVKNDKTNGYIIPDPVEFKIIKHDKTIEPITLHNRVKYGSLTVNKTSTDGIIDGFLFKVSGKTVFNESYVAFVETDVNGNAEFKNIPLGEYIVEEVKTEKTKSYVIEEPKQFSITDSNIEVQKTFNNVFKEGTLKIVKTSEDNKIEGISFNVKGTTVGGEDFEEVFVTDEKGLIEEIIPEGQYVVTEVRNEKTNHYVELQPFNVNVTHSNVTLINVENVLKKTLLTIRKTSDNNILQGFEFTVSGTTLGGDTFTNTYVTDKSGVISVPVPYGSYKVTESKVIGYIENSPIDLYINSEFTNVDVHNSVKLGDLTVNKTSTNGVIKGFDFKLTGTTVFDNKIEIVKSTNENGVVLFDDLMLGNYVIEEVNNNKVVGYIIESGKQFSLTDNVLHVEENFNNIFKQGTINIYKTSEDNKVENISFVVKGKTIEGLEYKETVKTNAEGKVSLVVPEGEYEITEVIDDNTKHYEEQASQNVSVKHDSINEIGFHNTLKKATLTITKTSDNNLVEGFEFTVSGTTLGGENYTITKTTDDKGLISFVIPYGTYTLTEKNVNGYVENSPMEIIVDKKEVNIDVHNKVKLGELVVSKTSTNSVIEGFDFKLTGTSVFGDKVEISKITDKNGNIIFDNLMLGTYEIEEIDNDKTVGYIIETKKSFTITEDKQKVNVSFNNIFKQGTVNITKKSEDNRVENIKFLIKGTTVEETSYEREFYTDDKGLISVILPEGEYTVEEVIDNNTSHYIPLDSQSIKVVHDSTTDLLFENILKKSNVKIIKTSSDDKVKDIDFTIKGTTLGGDEVEFVKTTDENGLIEFTTPYGDYVITEEELDGYVYKEPIEITVNEDETVVNIHNEVKVGKLKIKKTSTDGKVKGFSFTVKGKTETGDKYNKTFKTNKDGIIVINLPTGTYKVSEIKNDKTKNYIIPKPQEVNVFEDETTVIKFKNVRKEEKVQEKPSSPKTGDMNGNLAIFTFFISIAGCWLSLRGLKKNSK